MDASKKQREPVAFKSLAELKRFIRPGVELKTVSHANHADIYDVFVKPRIIHLNANSSSVFSDAPRLFAQ